jgi:hypothetical protein
MRQGRHAPLSPALAIGIAIVAAGTLGLLAFSKRKPRRAVRDYSGRSGFPRGAAQAHGLAADVARESARWLSRPGFEALPAARVRAMTHPAAPAG